MIIVWILLALVAALLVFATTRPNHFSVQRSINILAKPDRVLPLLTDFHRWPEWSPWEKLDPAMQRTHSGAANGVGAIYNWTGNSKVGAGRMEITGVQGQQRVSVKLDFFRPFKSQNLTEYTLEENGNATTVNWTMSGPATFVTKLMGVFVSMDKMIGKDFEAGLAQMKVVAERP
jgi:Polyketide cyclase / dehydrase and lipid transport